MTRIPNHLSHSKSIFTVSHRITAVVSLPQISYKTNLSIPKIPFPHLRCQIHCRSPPPLLLPLSAMDPAMSNPGFDSREEVADPEPNSIPTSTPNPNPNPKVLPQELSNNVVFLECDSSADGGFCGVYLVGTAHVSLESCREVQSIISYLKPQVVFLELCSSRVSLLTPQTLQVPTANEMIDMWKKKKMNTFGILYSWFLAKIADKLEVFPGAEFRVAFEEARSYGAKVILGDRPLQITLLRTWGKMSPWHRAKFIYYTLFQAVFLPSADDLNKMLKEFDDVDMLTLMVQELSKAFPTLMETLVHERDMYMSASLLNVAREHSSVVAVVGKGHLQGIKKHWMQPIEGRHLTEIPTKKRGLSKVKIFGLFGVAGLAIASGIYLMGKK